MQRRCQYTLCLCQYSNEESQLSNLPQTKIAKDSKKWALFEYICTQNLWYPDHKFTSRCIINHTPVTAIPRSHLVNVKLWASVDGLHISAQHLASEVTPGTDDLMANGPSVTRMAGDLRTVDLSANHLRVSRGPEGWVERQLLAFQKNFLLDVWHATSSTETVCENITLNSFYI